jgi:hypothetical protein
VTVGQKEYAIRKAYNVCDAWRDKYDFPNRFSTYYYEAMACVNEAAVIGIRAALGLKIRYKDDKIVDDDKEERRQSKRTIEFAKQTALAGMYDWNDCTGLMEDWQGLFTDFEDTIETAVTIGWRVAKHLAIRFDKDGDLIEDETKDFGSRGERD